MNNSNHIFELLSNDMYYVEADYLTCTIDKENENDVENVYVKISSQNIDSVELNNNRLSIGGRIHEGRKYIEKRALLGKDESNKFLSRFRGVIIGYPMYQFSVKIINENDTIICDAIKIKGGYKRPFPWFGYEEFTVEFISIQPDGELKKVKVLAADNLGVSFRIEKQLKEGQILCTREIYGNYLNPSDFVDFLNGVKTSYMGSQPNAWEAVKGTEISDSIISCLVYKIDFTSQVITFNDTQNLYQRTYEIISHSSMDPGNEERTESRDRYIWASYRFNEKSLIDIIKSISSCPKVSHFGEGVIKFKGPITKSEFTKITGVRLLESIIESEY